jgi:hypothetical protein
LEHCPIVLVLRKTKSCQAFVPSIRSIKPADNLVSLTEHERTGVAFTRVISIGLHVLQKAKS